MKVGIIGSRNINDVDQVISNLESVLRGLDNESGGHIVILGGDSKGSERICKDYIEGTPYDYVLFLPYNFVASGVEHDPKFFYYRNKQIIDNSDYLIVFLDHEEGGVGKAFVYLKYNTEKDYVAFGTTGGILESRG